MKRAFRQRGIVVKDEAHIYRQTVTEANTLKRHVDTERRVADAVKRITDAQRIHNDQKKANVA